MSKLGGCLVLCFLFIYCFVLGCALTENLATGTNYTFKSAISGKFQLIDWRHNRNLVVEWEPPDVPVWYRYQNRSRFNTETGDLSLQLTKEDSGVFQSNYDLAGTVKSNEITIKVIDPVPKPEVTCEQNIENATLGCAVKTSVPAEFRWEGPNGFSQVGRSLQITRKLNDGDSVYFCTANNEVSEETVEFKLKDCPKDAPPISNVGAIVGGIFGSIIVLILLGAGAVLYFKLKKGGKKSDRTPTNHTPDTHIPLTDS